MKYISRMSLYEYGMRICEKKFLPLIIRYFEPGHDQIPNQPELPEVDSIATVYEIQETINNYQVINFFAKYGVIFILSFVTYLVSTFFKIISIILTVPDWFTLATILILFLAFLVVWLGAYTRINNRGKEWKEIMKRQKLLEKMEYYSSITSSKIIAEIINEIEKQKKIQKRETQKTRDFITKRSIMQTKTMELFEEMMNERERKNKGKENRKAILSWFAGFTIGYILEKTLDTFVIGTEIKLGGSGN